MGVSHTLLFVCTANMLRSPSAELLARARGAEVADWQVTSSGTHALPGHHIDEDAGRALQAYGISPFEHRARQATPPLLLAADLVVTFEVRHRSWVLEQEPSLAGRVLTIRRVASLLVNKPRRADALDHLRWDAHPYGPADEFADPVGGGLEAITKAVKEIDALLSVILPAIDPAWRNAEGTGIKQ